MRAVSMYRKAPHRKKDHLMQDSLMQQGLDLMFYGMGSVAVFLMMLVVLTQMMSWFIQRYLPEAPTVTAATESAEQAPVDAHLLAIIQAAVNQHRARAKSHNK